MNETGIGNDTFNNLTDTLFDYHFPFNESTTTDTNSTARFFNYATAAYNILLLSIGSIGNILVLIVYGLRFKKSTFNTFIVFLAAMDLICCAIEMPLDAANMIHQEIIHGCKAIVTIATTTATATGLTLVAIAALRYRGICHPLKPNISICQSRIIVSVSFAIAIFCCWPTGVLVTDQIDHIEGGLGVINCAPEDRFVDTIYPVINSGILFIIFLSAFSAIVILYLMVARKLWLRKKYGISSNSNHKTSNQSSDSSTRALFSKSDNSGGLQKGVVSTQIANSQQKVQSGDSRNTKLKNQSMFRMLFVVTVMFMVSYVPHFSLMIYEGAAGKLQLTSVTESVVGIVIRSYLINSACNPIIYGCCSNKFREELKVMFF
ncbi:orexin receptor type 2 [Patella vulgata]|uniref:orexin receptor type 2 n=1 Tax=Patella vulgata TaxID=6465 RepID=UPI0021800C9F|nr:orexin receptor type 2 [Patella vulgata]